MSITIFNPKFIVLKHFTKVLGSIKERLSDDVKLPEFTPNSRVQSYANTVTTLTKKRITFFDKKITTQKKSKLAHLR